MSAEGQAVQAAVQAAAPVVTVEEPKLFQVMGQAPAEPAEVEPKVEPAAAAAVEVKKEVVAGSEEVVEDRAQRDEKGRFKPGVQDRIDELTRARREAEREAEYWKIRAQGTAPAAKAEAAAEVKQPPARANFQSDEDYVDALADFKVDQKLAQREQKQAEVQAQVSKADSWQSKLASARTEITDFDTVMNSATEPVAAHVAELIMEHDHGAKLAHHFAQNPAELEKINEMTPAKVAFELGRLATKFEKQSAASSEPAAAAVSKAPAPAGRTVGAGRSTTPALGDLSMEDYIKTRKAQGAGWARGH